MEDLGKIIEEQAKKIEAEAKRKQEAEESARGIGLNAEPIVAEENCRCEKGEKSAVDYGVNNGVAEYAGIKKPLPTKMQKILFSILAVMQTILIVLFCVPFSAVNIVADGLEGVVKKFETLSRPTRLIMLCAITALFALIVVLVIVRVASARASA